LTLPTDTHHPKTALRKFVKKSTGISSLTGRNHDACRHPFFARLITLAALGLWAAPAAAQHPQTREGFWGRFGLGWGSMGKHCDACDGLDRTGNYSGYVKLGGNSSTRPTPRGGAQWLVQERGWHDSADEQCLCRDPLVPDGAGRTLPEGRDGLFQSVG
jgi:hypothetical protein